ncbi:28S ribosomal protein S22, mitochondrial [Anthonomus grandis grandis]|uniref:28S ribosomal protein S22, mitochondrial n=1 Tax=Anthonomus grandis grandis TaxID=2921223 RepID=UPI0021661F78|nr:28S ribosomal protein S22, mitochondrial [Anthonomus grandis grandis]
MSGLGYAVAQAILHNSKNLCQSNWRTIRNLKSLVYDGKTNPAPVFFNPEVQALLKSLTRVNNEKVFRRKKLGTQKLSDPEYKFMTDEELQESLKEAENRANELLQIPPVIQVADVTTKVLARDNALQGLESSRMVFTDITYGLKDCDRLIVVREPDGTLQEAEWAVRQRIIQAYFPRPGKLIKPPKMFEGQYLEALLNKNEYEFILDRACTQFEPDDPDYQKIVSATYEHINENNKFDLLRSTRHFGSLVFYLAWHKKVDNLLLELIETLHIKEAKELIDLYSIMHKIEFDNKSDVDAVKDFIKKEADKKGSLELAMQAYEDVIAQKLQLKKEIDAAHGIK